MREGIDVFPCKVEHLIRQLGLRSVVQGQKRFFTTVSDPAQERVPDLVKRQFTAIRSDQLWIAVFTYVVTWSEFVYVAFVINVDARCIVGWRVSTSMKTDLGILGTVYLSRDAQMSALGTKRRNGTTVRESPNSYREMASVPKSIVVSHVSC
jgi:hypothetical protein